MTGDGGRRTGDGGRRTADRDDTSVILNFYFTKCRLPSVVCRPSPAVRRLPSVVCRPSSAVRRPPSAVRRPPSAVRRPPSAVRRLPSVVCRPPSAVLKNIFPILDGEDFFVHQNIGKVSCFCQFIFKEKFHGVDFTFVKIFGVLGVTACQSHF